MRLNETPCRHPGWVDSRCRRAAFGTLQVLVLVLLGLGLPGCGEPVVGGGGRLVRGPDGAPDLLVVEGSPYEMGWWQGKLLGRRIRDLHAAWQRAAFREVVGMVEDIETGQAGDLFNTVELYVDQALERLPEIARQELTGLADATGISAADLLFLEVMRDGLRVYVRALEPRLPGGLAAWATGPEAFAFWGGLESTRLGAGLLVTLRRPLDGVATISVGWPGALGGLAALSAGRQAYLTVEAEVGGEMRGFGKGVPFSIAARTALASGRDLERVRAAMGGTAGHALIVMGDPDPDAREGLGVIGSVEVYRGVQPEVELGELGYLVLGSDQDVRAGLAKAGLSVRPDSSKGLRARVLRAARARAGPARAGRPEVRIDWGAETGIAFEVGREGAARHLRVVLQRTGVFGVATHPARERSE